MAGDRIDGCGRGLFARIPQMDLLWQSTDHGLGSQSQAIRGVGDQGELNGRNRQGDSGGGMKLPPVGAKQRTECHTLRRGAGSSATAVPCLLNGPCRKLQVKSLARSAPNRGPVGVPSLVDGLL